MTAIRRALLVLSVAPLLVSIAVYADTLHVPEDYSTIQAAIDAAQSDDTITIAAGTYHENLAVKRSIVLSSAPAEEDVLVEIDSVNTGTPVLLVQGTSHIDVTLRGITLSGADGWWSTEAGPPVGASGIAATGEASLSIEECVLSDNLVGVCLLEQVEASLLGCAVHGNDVGIWAMGSVSLSIAESSVCSNAQHGVHLEGQATGSFVGTSISANGIYGCWFRDSVDVTMRGSAITENRKGVQVADEANARLISCESSDNELSGVHVLDTCVVDLEQCTIERNQHGIVAEGGPTVTASGCVFRDNVAWGIAPSATRCGTASDVPFSGTLEIGDDNEFEGNGAGGICRPEVDAVVGPGDREYPSIQDALHNVTDGGRILVRPGRYVENLVIDKNVSIVGESASFYEESRVAVIEPRDPNRPTMLATGGSIHVEDLLFIGGTTAFQIEGDCLASLVNCRIKRADTAVRAGSSADVSMEYCGITTGGDGVVLSDAARLDMIWCWLEMGRGVGVMLSGSSRAVLRNCEIIEEGEHGLAATDAAYAELLSSWFVDSGSDGIILEEAASAYMCDCIIESNMSSGIRLRDSAGLLLLASYIEENTGSGIAIEGGQDVRILANEIHDNGDFGIACAWGDDRGRRPAFLGNHFSGNRSGDKQATCTVAGDTGDADPEEDQ